MLKKIGLYLREICAVFIGFYLMAIILVYAIDTNQSFAAVLNSLGLFLSSVGVIVAILTVMQQHYLHQAKQIDDAVNSSNNFMFKLGCMLETYGNIKNNYLDQSYNTPDSIRLLDGIPSHWLIEIDLEKTIFISEIDAQIYVDSYYAIFNYNRYVEGVFRWQRNQKLHKTSDNEVHLLERMNGLDEFGSKLIELQDKLYKVLKHNYPEHTFFHSNVPFDEFKNLVKTKPSHGKQANKEEQCES